MGTTKSRLAAVSLAATLLLGFTLDTLKAPASRHFLCKMNGQMANKLRGKIINVTADGAVVTKHRVEPFNEKDEYVFPVDLEAVEVGPVNTFEL